MFRIERPTAPASPQEDAPEIENLDTLIENAREVLSGRAAFARNLATSLQEALDTTNSGFGNEEREEATEILTELPRAEVRNCLGRAHGFLAERDYLGAEAWLDHAKEALTQHADTLSDEDSREFTKDIGEIKAKLPALSPESKT